MKKNNTYYRAVTRITQEKRNAYKIVESNERAEAEKEFKLMEETLKHRKSEDWCLTLEIKEGKVTQIIKIRGKENIDSPLY